MTARHALRALLAACVIVAAAAGPAAGAVARQGESAVAQVSSGTSATASFAANPAPGNSVLVFVQTAGTIMSVVDNGSTPTTFARDVSTIGGKGAAIYRANDIKLPASGSYAVTVTVSGASTIQVKAIEFAGLAGGPPTATNTGAGTGTAVTSNAVTSTGDALFIGGFSDNSSLNPQTIAFGSSATGLVENWRNANGSTWWPSALADGIVSGAATKSVTWTLGSSSAWGAVIAAYAAVPTTGDATSPETTITSSPSDPSSSSSATFAFTGTDDVTPATSLAYQCRLDAAAFAACTSPRSYSGLSDGAHTFEVRAIDASGNVDPTPASRTWQVATSSPGTDRLPDLGMGRVDSLSIDTKTMPGHRLLRFNGTLANAGAGPFEVYGARSSTGTSTMSVEQRIRLSTGGYRSVATSAEMYYAGDGHNHWHIKNLEGARLTDVHGNAFSAPYAKMGFCPSDNAIYDASVPGTPSSAAYSGCGNGHPELLSVLAGISTGWGDWYGPTVANQWLDITGLPNGAYRIWVTADPNGEMLESNEANNTTWTEIKIDNRVRIVAYGPHI